ncbi:MAG: DUF5107 domain-containing protein [Verrucomicrobiae bacterium]|nr:DUF5107 domain-containing protein [Verrucomicrobiae bacterium]NNJ87639.1 DUF5107 domain-containing protein [Akkermansiaceae bacterium]
MSVIAKIEPRVIPSYPLGEPEKNPLFFEKRVYQGSNGKVYPVPFVDKVYDEPVDVSYQSVLLENDCVRLVMLPEIGGRIFLGQDKTNDDYDFFYRQDVIKPALVGLAGPWISGGVEFNWPQHHRPGTYMPADVHIEEEEDGARTVWMSEHDPLNRLKGMHGIRLRPGSSLIELRARLYNRTPHVQTFLWWANVAAQVHDRYQSFFPQDVHYVADHAVRAISSFPIADNPYYDIPYQDRPGANDLGWYKNIPVPTSYMVCQTNFDFFGGYDFSKDGGFVHVANRHIAPGKKQWTWGNDEFGYAWDRELTDEGGPYVELMAGVYTDNQPDFTYLLPYETKTFSQYWWPIQDIGPVQQANTKAALACSVSDDLTVKLGLCVSEKTTAACLVVINQGERVAEFPVTLSPGESWLDESVKLSRFSPSGLQIKLLDSAGTEILSYQTVDRSELTRDRDNATEPPLSEEVESTDELYLIGEHLEQYRHPTRDPDSYWKRAVEKDPADVRSQIALGKRALNRGELSIASDHFESAITSLTKWHPNPVTGEAHYHLGLTKIHQGDHDIAYGLLYKSTWNYEWRSCAYYQLATLDCRKGEWSNALTHLEASLDTNRQNNKAQVLKAAILRKLDQRQQAQTILDDLLEVDALDHWARYEQHLLAENSTDSFLNVCRNDAQTLIDLAFDYCDAGLYEDALGLLKVHHDHTVSPVAVPNPLDRSSMTRYMEAWIKSIIGHPDADSALAKAKELSADHFFPSRLDEMLVLEWALVESEDDPVAAYALGNFYYDKRRYADAIRVWELAADAETPVPQVYRNLGIAYWNHGSQGEKAAAQYQKAIQLDPDDARLISEFDQLSQKRNLPVTERLKFLEGHQELVFHRDDATVSLASLYNLTNEPEKALNLLTSRRFHPWEGGEGAVLRQYTTARLLLGQKALEDNDPALALRQFQLAMETPESLGEAYHPLQAKADVNYWKGMAYKDLGDDEQARAHFEFCAKESGDFSSMAVTEHSPLSYYRGLSLRELGLHEEATALFNELLAFGENGLSETAQIDYFATSLPNLLVFDEDLQSRSDADCHLLIALAHHGLGDHDKVGYHVDHVTAFACDNMHAVALAGKLTE